VLDALIRLLTLTPTQREVWVDRHVVGQTCRQVAERHGISAARVGQIDQAARERLSRVVVRAA